MSKRTALLTKEGKKFALFLFENEKHCKTITIHSEDEEIIAFTLKNRLGLPIEEATYSMVAKGSVLSPKASTDQSDCEPWMVGEGYEVTESEFDTTNEQEQKLIKTNILGGGVLEKLRLAVIYFVDSDRKPIGTGFFVGPRVAISVAHAFTEAMRVGTKRTGYFGKPHVGRTCQLVVDLIDRENDFVVFAIQSEGEDAEAYLEPAPVGLDPGDECILAAYQLGIHHELEELGKEPSVGVFPGAITKAHERHFVYSAPSFAGDSGGAIILRGGQASGMHIMTVNQALELQRLKSLDEDEATTGDVVQHVNSVEKSVASLIESLSSGALGLSISSVMAAYRSNQESKRRAS